MQTILMAGNDLRMKKNKLVLGIIGALMMIVCTFFLAFYAIRDYHISENGLIVQGEVTDNSAVCRSWNKYVRVLYGGEEFEIHLYGPECRSAEFSLNRSINLRSNKSGSVVVLESNRYVFRVCFMSLLFLLSFFVNILMYNQYKFWKRAARAQASKPA